MFEIVVGELHAKLGVESAAIDASAGHEACGVKVGPGCVEESLAGLRDDAPHISDLAPLVWRAPEGPEGTGGLRGAAPNEVRPPSLAGGRALRRPEHPWGRRPRAHQAARPTRQATRRPEHQRRHKQQHSAGARARRPAPLDATTQTRTLRSTCVRSRSAHAARQSRRSSRSPRLRRRAGPRR